jgi:hypothetical protein
VPKVSVTNLSLAIGFPKHSFCTQYVASLPGSNSLKAKAEWNHKSSSNLSRQSFHGVQSVPTASFPAYNSLKAVESESLTEPQVQQQLIWLII